MMKNDFIRAIQEEKLVEVVINSKEKGEIKRKCVPFDFGPSRRSKSKTDKYHFYDLNSPEGEHNLSVQPEYVKNLIILDEEFNPADFVKWKTNWFIERDWGIYS